MRTNFEKLMPGVPVGAGPAGCGAGAPEPIPAPGPVPEPIQSHLTFLRRGNQASAAEN